MCADGGSAPTSTTGGQHAAGRYPDPSVATPSSGGGLGQAGSQVTDVGDQLGRLVNPEPEPDQCDVEGQLVQRVRSGVPAGSLPRRRPRRRRWWVGSGSATASAGAYRVIRGLVAVGRGGHTVRQVAGEVGVGWGAWGEPGATWLGLDVVWRGRCASGPAGVPQPSRYQCRPRWTSR